jgi:hypothetical protein
VVAWPRKRRQHGRSLAEQPRNDVAGIPSTANRCGWVAATGNGRISSHYAYIMPVWCLDLPRALLHIPACLRIRALIKRLPASLFALIIYYYNTDLKVSHLRTPPTLNFTPIPQVPYNTNFQNALRRPARCLCRLGFGMFCSPSAASMDRQQLTQYVYRLRKLPQL